MNYRTLGRTGLDLSQVGFGCGNVGGLMIRGEPGERVRAVARAIEMSINYFDSAPSYGNGQSERNLGQVLKELGAEVYVGTKVHVSGEEKKDLKGALMRSVEDSLKRLDREYVDLIQLHDRITLHRSPTQGSLSAEDVLDEVVEAFQSLQVQGKIRFFGITGLGDTDALHRVIEAGALHTVQACYNLLNPSAGAEVPADFYAQDFGGLIDRASEKETGIIVIRVLAAGALSGVEERHPIAAPSVPPISSGRDYDEDVSRARGFGFLVKEGYVEDMVEAAIRFSLSKAGVSTVLVGYSSLEQVERAAKCASKGPLPPEALDRLPEVWSQFTRM